MTPDPISVALVYGSKRQGRLCEKVGAWAASRISAAGMFSCDLIDPAALRLDERHSGHAAELVQLSRQIEKADAFIVVTPEYNHSYPAVLKSLIDSVHQPWHAKPVAFVSYGGVSGGLRAVEHLRAVFAELHAVTVRDGVSFPNVWSHFDANGLLLNPAQANKSMDVLLRRLAWWATALREARNATPFERAAA